jgi:hypothetical protein
VLHPIGQWLQLVWNESESSRSVVTRAMARVAMRKVLSLHPGELFDQWSRVPDLPRHFSPPPELKRPIPKEQVIQIGI